MPNNSGIPTLADLFNMAPQVAQQLNAQKKLQQDREMPQIEQDAKDRGKQTDIQNLQQMFGADNAQDAVRKAQVGGRGFEAAGIKTTPDNAYRVAQVSQKELDHEQKAIADATKSLGIPEYSKRVTAINNALNNLTLKNTMGDMAATLQETMATLGPSGSRALGVVLRQKGLVPDTSEGTVNSWINKARSQAGAVIPQDVASSMVDYLKSQKDQVASEYGNAKNRLAAGLPNITRIHRSMGIDPNPTVSMYTGPLEDSFKQTDDLVGKLKQPPQTTQPFQQPAARTAADGMVNKLKSFFSPAQPQQPQQPQVNPQPVDPVAEEMKRRGLAQ